MNQTRNRPTIVRGLVPASAPIAAAAAAAAASEANVDGPVRAQGLELAELRDGLAEAQLLRGGHPACLRRLVNLPHGRPDETRSSNRHP